jgi:tripartite-type tricarboxylate transporter receptor subunit TctC
VGRATCSRASSARSSSSCWAAVHHENRPGAGGNVAAEQVARAPADGHTLLMGNNSILATNAALYKKSTFDPESDFAPISLVGSQANILVVNPATAGALDGRADRYCQG